MATLERLRDTVDKLKGGSRKSAFPGVFILALWAVPVCARAQTITLSEVLTFNVPDLKPDADARAFETLVVSTVAPAWRKDNPEAELTLVRRDRGSHRGQYLLVCTTRTVARCDFRQDLTPFVKSAGLNIEYRLVAPEKVAPFPAVDILGVHYIKVRPDRVDAFDRFVAEKLHPAVGNLRPDLRLLYYKPVRGDDAGNYITVFALTKASRDKYWPKGSDSAEVKAAFEPSVTALTTELSSYLVEGSYATGNLAAAVFESKEWADWLVIR
jgi:hypothetical protein